mmetsp:Transcript_27179/g.24060  ORF Transcript_27179/g.24060 Transcript_27179/m.24060 type:complete len:189 (-) Transcript_27179:1302-1868(-)
MKEWDNNKAAIVNVVFPNRTHKLILKMRMISDMIFPILLYKNKFNYFLLDVDLHEDESTSNEIDSEKIIILFCNFVEQVSETNALLSIENKDIFYNICFWSLCNLPIIFWLANEYNKYGFDKSVFKFPIRLILNRPLYKSEHGFYETFLNLTTAIILRQSYYDDSKHKELLQISKEGNQFVYEKFDNI